MTAKKDLKRRVRERQAQTGESYAAARSHVVAAKQPPREDELSGEPAAPQTPAEEPPSIPVEEVIDLTDRAAPLGIKCMVGMSTRLADKADPVKILERVRDTLLATADDPDLDLLRAVVLRGERPWVPEIRSASWLTESRRFIRRAINGIGGVSDGGNMLAMHVDGKHGALLVICTAWFRRSRAAGYNEPRLMLTTADGMTSGPEMLWTMMF